MTSPAAVERVLFENLPTSFVNLWALLRYLSQRSFVGRVQVRLENYEADIFLDGQKTPLVHEMDRGAGTDLIEEAALHRLVLRVRESPGEITVYESADEAIAPATEPVLDASPQINEGAKPDTISVQSSSEETVTSRSTAPIAAAEEWHETVKLSGELIAAVERAAEGTGADFLGLFREARVALADDYEFLDPFAGMRYENGSVTMNGAQARAGYVVGVCTALRRVVDRFATGEKDRRARERVALELARVARQSGEGVARSGFQEQLDRIAGTKVL